MKAAAAMATTANEKPLVEAAPGNAGGVTGGIPGAELLPGVEGTTGTELLPGAEEMTGEPDGAHA